MWDGGLPSDSYKIHTYYYRDGCCHSRGDRTVHSQDAGHHGDLIGSYRGDRDENGNLMMNDHLGRDDMHDWKNTLADHCWTW